MCFRKNGFSTWRPGIDRGVVPRAASDRRDVTALPCLDRRQLIALLCIDRCIGDGQFSNRTSFDLLYSASDTWGTLDPGELKTVLSCTPETGSNVEKCCDPAPLGSLRGVPLPLSAMSGAVSELSETPCTDVPVAVVDRERCAGAERRKSPLKLWKPKPDAKLVPGSLAASLPSELSTPRSFELRLGLDE